MDTAVVLEAFVDPDVDLRAQPIAARVDWSANDRRESRFDEYLTAHDDESSSSTRVSRRGVLNEIHVASSHSGTWYARASSASAFNSTACSLMIARSPSPSPRPGRAK